MIILAFVAHSIWVNSDVGARFARPDAPTPRPPVDTVEASTLEAFVGSSWPDGSKIECPQMTRRLGEVVHCTGIQDDDEWIVRVEMVQTSQGDIRARSGTPERVG